MADKPKVTRPTTTEEALDAVKAFLDYGDPVVVLAVLKAFHDMDRRRRIN